jgi:hypothetical protein
MTAGELVLILLALLLVIGFTALIVVLLRVHDTLRDLRQDVVQLRAETGPLLEEMRTTTDEAKNTVDEARTDLERFDKVLGSAEAIGDAVGGRVARTVFSSPAIKAAGFAKGTARTWSRLRGKPMGRTLTMADPEVAGKVIDVRDRGRSTGRTDSTERRRRRA